MTLAFRNTQSGVLRMYYLLSLIALSNKLTKWSCLSLFKLGMNRKSKPMNGSVGSVEIFAKRHCDWILKFIISFRFYVRINNLIIQLHTGETQNIQR